MRRVVTASAFERDLKRAIRRGKDIQRLKELIRLLANGDTLPPRYRDHPLKGEWRGWRDAHIEPDWLLLSRIEGDELRLARTGTHADLFGK